MQRFFIETSHLWDKELILQDDEIMYQLVKVLRAKTWDEVIFFDSKIFIDFVYKITSIDKKNIIFSFVAKIEKVKENCKIILFQALPNKIDKIEEIISKWTQIGYSEFNFFRSERSQDLRLSENKIQRFNKIIKEASEQSNRSIIPKLNFLQKIDFSKISGFNIFFHTDKNNSKNLFDLKLDYNEDINIFVWPEWWFSPRENELFEKSNFIKVNLWDNILRSENTPIVVWFYLLQKKSS